MNEYSEVVKLIRTKWPTVGAVYLYGSQAVDQATQDSDVDIAVLSSTRIQNVVRYQLAQEIADFLNKEVDLVDLRACETVFQFQVVSTGKRLWIRDAFEAGSFEDRVYKMYAKLGDERGQILQDIKNRGSIL